MTCPFANRADWPELTSILEKCIMNLTINNAEATQSGTVFLQTSNREITAPVKNYESVKSGQYVLLSVVDDGPGMSSEDIERIFEPFYIKKKLGRSGTGFGLTVVRSTIQYLQGFVEIK